MTKPTPVSLSREKFLQEVNSLTQKPSHPLAKTKTLVKSLMNRAELLLHVTIAAQSGLTRSISGTPAETPGTAPGPGLAVFINRHQLFSKNPLLATK